MIKKLAPYTKGYRLLMLFAIACSAGEAGLGLAPPPGMGDIVGIGLRHGGRGHIPGGGRGNVSLSQYEAPAKRVRCETVEVV